MKRFGWVALGFVLLPFVLSSQGKKHKIPAVFDHARYVWVEAVDGDQFKPSLLPEDRQAISDVQDAIQDWNRYVLTASRNEADLVFIVRKGRVASAKLGGTVATAGPSLGQQRPVGTGGMVGAEAGPPDDLLQICQLQPDGTLSAPLWIRSEADGLHAPEIPLLKQLRTAVDRDYPIKTSGQPAHKP